LFLLPRFVVRNGVGYVQREQHDVFIRVYDEAGNVIETHEHKGEVKGTISTLPIDKIEKLAASERIAPCETATES
jgi:hypothetical protein